MSEIPRGRVHVVEPMTKLLQLGNHILKNGGLNERQYPDLASARTIATACLAELGDSHRSMPVGASSTRAWDMMRLTRVVASMVDGNFVSRAVLEDAYFYASLAHAPERLAP